jgi:hypothetical protein
LQPKVAGLQRVQRLHIAAEAREAARAAAARLPLALELGKPVVQACI